MTSGGRSHHVWMASNPRLLSCHFTRSKKNPPLSEQQTSNKQQTNQLFKDPLCLYTNADAGLGHRGLEACVESGSACVSWSQLSNEAISGQAAAAGRTRKQLQSLRPIICLVLITITRVRSTCCCRCGHRDACCPRRDHREPGNMSKPRGCLILC